jgi:hypothetical protein
MTETGPEYPPPPGPWSNAVGEFTVGISPVGTIPLFQVEPTIISQYANSPIINRLIYDFFHYIDQTQNFDSFFDNVWNVLTANGYGLDVWGRIVNIGRSLEIETGSYFGFIESTTASGFGQAPFYTGEPLTSVYELSAPDYLRLILAKAAFNITDGSIPQINRLMMALFPDRGNCYVRDGNPSNTYFGFIESTTALGFGQAPFAEGNAASTMVMAYVFTFPLTNIETAIVEQSGVLPKPTGVQASYVYS